MKATLDEIQAALKHALETIEGLRAYAIEPDQPPSLEAVAYPRVVDWTYDEAWGEPDDLVPTLWHFDIWVLVSLSSGLNRAQTQLNPFISPVGRRSIKAALERDVSLRETVDSVRLVGGGAYGTADLTGIRCLAASMRAEIHA